ncbi:MAG TPA: class I SAM-dependent methyltransferase [Anaerolinea sp.]|nr:class I SAM-dependent methyltransferase [Anaerolinea sp.]
MSQGEAPAQRGGEVKQQVRQFYDQVGWQKVTGDLYQNARYEDLRPVSAEYIHRCHLRVSRHLAPAGRFFLDAGSGPVQYPEYATYSRGYAYRVCADISIVALQEARRRLGEHALCVVADVANLPFAPGAFDGAVSLHTLHHLPLDEQGKAYGEIFRVLVQGRSAVVVNGWTDSPLMRRSAWLVRLAESLGMGVARLRGRAPARKPAAPAANPSSAPRDPTGSPRDPTGTFVNKLDAAWLRGLLAGKMHFEIYTWRSVSVRWLRALVHSATGGRLWLRLLFALEERYPRWFGENGQYPLVVIYK